MNGIGFLEKWERSHGASLGEEDKKPLRAAYWCGKYGIVRNAFLGPHRGPSAQMGVGTGERRLSDNFKAVGETLNLRTIKGRYGLAQCRGV